MKRLLGFIILIMLIGAVMWSGCRPPELEGVVINMNQGLYDKAYELAQESVEKYPDNPEAWYRLGELHGHFGKFIEMNEAFEKSLSLSANFATQIEQLRLKYFADNYNNALRNNYDKARDIQDPAERKELFGKAAELFLNAHQAMPDRIEPLTPMSISYLESGDTITAEKYILKAIDMNPKNDTLIVVVGDFYFKINNMEKAQMMYVRAVNANPNNTDAHLALGEIYAKAENWDKAIEEFDLAMNQQPDNSAIPMNISIIYYNNERYEQAIPYIQKTIELMPENEDMYELLSLSYLQSAQKYHEMYDESENAEYQQKTDEIYSKALPFLEDAVTKFPNSALLWNNLGVVYAQKGIKDKAEMAFEKQKQLEETE
jgi:tetratricopeptide (TPR) repeat protein